MQPDTLTPPLPDLGAYAERIHLGALPAGEVLPASAFVEQAGLSSALQRLASRVGTADLRVAASLWAKQYNAAVLMGAMAAMTLHGIGLDLSLEKTHIVLRDGIPRALAVPDLSTAVVYLPRCGDRLAIGDPCKLPDLHHRVFTSVFAGHIAPVVDALCHQTGVSRAVLWGSVGNLLAELYDTWEDAGLSPEAVLADRHALLEEPDTVGLPSPNPLVGCVEYVGLREPGLPIRARVRRTCCQKYLAATGKHCTTCPSITLQQRVQLLHESRKKH